MDSLRLILRSALYYRRAHFGLAAGTALAAAILTGALAVGDAVDHTLHTFAAQRLGKAEYAVLSGERLFSMELGAGLREQTKAPISTVLALPGMAIHQGANATERKQVNRVQALGVDDEFWKLGTAPGPTLARREAAIDERLAARLGAKAGDTVALRIVKPGLLSRDAPLSSRQEDPSGRANFVVKQILSDAAMGRFGLSPSQLPPLNFFVRIDDLQELAGQEQQANLMLASGTSEEQLNSGLASAWRAEYAGVQLVRRAEGVQQLESNRIFIDDVTAKAALSLPNAQGALTYLVNGIRYGDKATPYSFMTAADSLTQGLSDNSIVINQWLADQLKAKPGDSVTVSYFQVLPSNQFEERTRDFTLASVLPMDAFAQERALVPEFPGLSNVESCRDWKIGMPMDEQLLKDAANEEYWKQYNQTPKALVTLAAGQAMWANRFGSLTGVRFPASDDSTAIMQQLAQKVGPKQSGIELRSVREEGAAAASQAMDLGGLFLGMSFFLLISSLVLTGMFYAFGTQQRSAQLGILAALGFTRGRIRMLLLGETLLVAIPSAVIGAFFGLAYAWLLMLGLANLWQNAIGHIPVLFHVEASSIAIGIVATLVCALGTAALTLRRLLRHDANTLLTADFSQTYHARTRSPRTLALAIASGVLAIALVAWGFVSPPADVSGLFFGSGAMALISGLLFALYLLSLERVQKPHVPTPLSLALLNASRRRGRSLALVASLAAGGFLVLAVSAMQSDLSAHAAERWSGTGGFALYAESTVPILDPAELESAAPGIRAMPIRASEGDDASCLNLNHAIRPRVLGVDADQLANAGAFTDADAEALWGLLNQDLGADAIPALVGDSDTAMWTLRKATGENGDTIAYQDEAGKELDLKLVGKLPMRLSVFQGTILISTKNFTRLWPSIEGFRVFLIDSPANTGEDNATKLQNKFDRYGLDVTTTVERLEMFHAVESTYLNIFLVLGGMGMLLGASATGVVVLRNLVERRREIALLRALGFSPRAVWRLLASEYGLLLLLGAGIGAAASVVAMLPSMTAAHGGASPLWRLAVFAFVLASAGLCALAALGAGLPKTSTADLRAE